MKGFTLCEKAQHHICVKKVDEVWCIPIGGTKVPVEYTGIDYMERYENALAKRVKNQSAVDEMLDRRVEKDGQPAMRMKPEQAEAKLVSLACAGYPFKNFEIQDGVIHVLNQEDVVTDDDRAIVSVAVGAPTGKVEFLSSDYDSRVEVDMRFGGHRIGRRYKDFPSPGITKHTAGFDDGVSCCLISMVKGSSFRMRRDVEDGDDAWREMTVSWKWINDRERKREFDRQMRKWAAVRATSPGSAGPKPVKKRPGLDLATYCWPS